LKIDAFLGNANANEKRRFSPMETRPTKTIELLKKSFVTTVATKVLLWKLCLSLFKILINRIQEIRNGLEEIRNNILQQFILILQLNASVKQGHKFTV
jgi:hypothetical protein